MTTTSPASVPGAPTVGGRRRGASVKTLKRMLKKAGLKTTGRKAALTRRAKKAHLKLKGGAVCAEGQTPETDGCEAEGGRRRRRH